MRFIFDGICLAWWRVIYCSPHSLHYDGGKFGHYSLQISKIKYWKGKRKEASRSLLTWKRKGGYQQLFLHHNMICKNSKSYFNKSPSLAFAFADSIQGTPRWLPLLSQSNALKLLPWDFIFSSPFPPWSTNLDTALYAVITDTVIAFLACLVYTVIFLLAFLFSSVRQHLFRGWKEKHPPVRLQHYSNTIESTAPHLSLRDRPRIWCIPSLCSWLCLECLRLAWYRWFWCLGKPFWTCREA